MMGKLYKCRKMKLDHLLTPNTRINSKWIKDLNIKPKTIKILEENISSKISGNVCSNVLSDTSPQARETKEKINKWDYIKQKSFYAVQETINKIKRQPMKWKNIFTNTSDKGLISKIYKEFQTSTPKKQITQLKNRQRTWIDTSSKRTYRWPK